MNPSDDRESLLRVIVESRRRLAEIDAERLELAAALSILEARFTASISEPEVVGPAAQPAVVQPLSTAAKIALFRKQRSAFDPERRFRSEVSERLGL